MAISNEILSSTLRILKDDAVDNLFQSTPLLKYAKDKGNVEMVDGGQKYDLPAILAEHAGITQLSSGYERIDTSAADVMRTASFEWCDFAAPVNITKKEEMSNKGERAIVNIAKARMEEVLGQLKREWEKAVVAGSSTILSDLQTFEGVDGTGWFEEGAFGSGQTNSVGGLSKSTYAGSNWNNQIVDAGSALSLDNMHDLKVSMDLYTDRGGLDCIIGSPNFWKTYRGLLSDLERYSSKDQLDGGRSVLLYAGAPVMANPFLPAAGVAATISAYFLNLSYVKVVFDKDGYFDMDDFVQLDDYVSRRARFYVRTQIVTNHLASQGLLVNAEA